MINKITRLLVVIAFAKALFSCNTTNPVEQEIAAVPVDIELVKFHQIFAEASAKDLPILKQQFPQFFPARTPNEIWLNKIEGKDTIQNVLEEAVQNADFDYEQIENDIEDVMRHIKFYFPEFEPVNVITVFSEVDTNLKVVPTPDFLLLGIDNYLGQDHELYAGINKYKSVTMEPNRIPADVGLAYAQLFVPPVNDRRFMEQMIYNGKLHYLQHQFVPNATTAQLMGYNQDKAVFAEENEEQIYRYFVDRELLYSSDPKLNTRFLLPAPFSKFYLEIDQETPGAVGQYLGYQIVSSFMENNELTLDDLIQTPAEEIFNKSKYKPRS